MFFYEEGAVLLLINKISVKIYEKFFFAITFLLIFRLPSFVFHSVCFASLLIDFISFSVVLFLYCHTNIIVIFVNDARRLERDIKDKSKRMRENRNMMKFIFLLAFVTAAQSLSSEEIDDITSKIDSGKSYRTNHIILRI